MPKVWSQKRELKELAVATLGKGGGSKERNPLRARSLQNSKEAI